MSRIFKRGKIWYVDFEYNGKRYRKSLGTRSKHVADLALKDIDVKISKEILNLGPPKKMNFEGFAEKFLKWYEGQNAQKSYYDYLYLFRATIVPYFARMNLSDIKPMMIEEYKLQRAKQVSPSSVNKDLVALRHLLNKAIKWGYLNQNPAFHKELFCSLFDGYHSQFQIQKLYPHFEQHLQMNQY